MGVLLNDLVKPLHEEDLAFFLDILSLIAHHEQEAQHYQDAIADYDQTVLMLDYLKRAQEKRGDIGPHALLLTETHTQRHIATQQLTHHCLTAEVFHSHLKDVLIERYHIHRNTVEEWHVDVEKREVYRRVGMKTEEVAVTRDEAAHG